MPLPPDLAQRVADADGGKWVLVIGAGSSVEPPTGLPTGAECSRDAHRRLRLDGVLETDCQDPSDLSAVADAVFAARGQQVAVVHALPVTRFRTATPNRGHMAAAALLAEGSLAAVVSLNFDFAMQAALSATGTNIPVVNGPDDLHALGTTNLIYLHRNAHAPPEEWVLRSEFLNKVWNERWEPAIAQKILLSPAVVFAGIGSPAASLTETARLLRAALPKDTVQFYQVDYAPYGPSKFTEALELPAAQYLQSGWCEFMTLVSGRLLEEHLSQLGASSVQLQADNAYAPADMDPVTQQCRQLGLVAFGFARSRWLLQKGPYLPMRGADPRLLADILLTIAFLNERLGAAPVLREDGAVQFRLAGRGPITLNFASGMGVKKLSAIEAMLASHSVHGWRGSAPSLTVVTGHLPSPEPTAPVSIVGGAAEDDIVAGVTAPRVMSAYALRDNGDTLGVLVS